MKKIVIVADTGHPKVDGITRSVMYKERLLERSGWQVLVIHPGLFKSIPFPLYPEVRLALWPGRRMRALIDAFAPTHMHIETEGPLGFAARGLCLRRGWRFTTTYHTHLQLYADVYARLPVRFLLYPAESLLRWFHSAAVRTMVSTTTLQTELTKRGYRNLVLCPLGVDTKLFERNLQAQVGKHLERPVFAYFSRLAPEKSPEDFLSLELPGTKLVIGDGPSRSKLERMYPQAVFAGFKQGQELVDWLSCVDVTVFPSKTETFGLVVLESFACGIPVAARPVMGPMDTIEHGVTGILSEDLQQAALACLELDRSALRQKALRHSWEASVDAFESNLVPIKDRR